MPTFMMPSIAPSTQNLKGAASFHLPTLASDNAGVVRVLRRHSSNA
jgi:hypothetical protein